MRSLPRAPMSEAYEPAAPSRARLSSVPVGASNAGPSALPARGDLPYGHHSSTLIGGSHMQALVYHGPGHKAWEEVATPTVIDDTDAVVRVDAVTICGTDLHILKGDVP